MQLVSLVSSSVAYRPEYSGKLLFLSRNKRFKIIIKIKLKFKIDNSTAPFNVDDTYLNPMTELQNAHLPVSYHTPRPQKI
jgi:hypothetical protein